MKYKTDGLDILLVGNCCNHRFAKALSVEEAKQIADALNLADNPELSETDRIARDYFASGRKLKIQARYKKNNYCKWDTCETTPGFYPDYEYRIKPEPRMLVVFESLEHPGTFGTYVKGSYNDAMYEHYTAGRIVKEFTLEQ